MEAISHAGTVLGVLAKDGVVLAAEKKVTGKLLDMSLAKDGGYGGSGEKIFLLNSCVPSFLAFVLVLTAILAPCPLLRSHNTSACTTAAQKRRRRCRRLDGRC